MHPATVARLHGLFNVAGGLWPLVHLPSFEAVSGPKTDRWLVRTVAALMVVDGLTQLAAAPTDDALPTARRLGVGTALTLAVVDVRYASTGRISRVYLLDAAVELGWVAAWIATLPPPQGAAGRAPGRRPGAGGPPR